MGGVIGSRALAELADVGIRNLPLPMLGQKFLSWLYLVGRLDFPTYVLRNFLSAKDRPGGQDIEQFVLIVAGKDNNGGRLLTYTGLLLLAGVDIYFDWERMGRHFKVLGGYEYETPTEKPSFSLGLSFRYGIPQLALRIPMLVAPSTSH